MKTLTYEQLYELAPGAAPIPSKMDTDRLLDTDLWLDDVYGPDFRPVFGMQGSTHVDGGEQWSGRHLVVAAREDGVAFSLLNSHCRLQRVWAGLGLWHDGELLLAKVIPLRRWDWAGWALSPKWEGLTVTKVLQTKHHLMRSPSGDELAEKIARSGYIAGRGRPSAKALRDRRTFPFEGGKGLARGVVTNVLADAASLVKVARRGNLPPSGKDKDRRNVKGIRRPDAYQHLALAAWKAAVEVAK